MRPNSDASVACEGNSKPGWGREYEAGAGVFEKAIWYLEREKTRILRKGKK